MLLHELWLSNKSWVQKHPSGLKSRWKRVTTDLLSDLEQVTSMLNTSSCILICVVEIITLTPLCKNGTRINFYSLQYNFRILLFVSEVVCKITFAVGVVCWKLGSLDLILDSATIFLCDFERCLILSYLDIHWCYFFSLNLPCCSFWKL